MRHVIVPQAVRRVVPPLLNDFISLQKDVALVSILGPQEAFRVAQIEAASDFNYTPFLAAALLYLLRDRAARARSSTTSRPRRAGARAGRGDVSAAPRSWSCAGSPRPTATARCCAASTWPWASTGPSP